MYACTANLTGPTVNRVTVTGAANGLTTSAYAEATVLMSADTRVTPTPTPTPKPTTPGLPNTGLADGAK
jgi:hypothetical protein